MSPKKENELGEFLNGRTGANNILLNTERKRLGFIGGKVSYSAAVQKSVHLQSFQMVVYR